MLRHIKLSRTSFSSAPHHLIDRARYKVYQAVLPGILDSIEGKTDIVCCISSRAVLLRRRSPTVCKIIHSTIEHSENVKTHLELQYVLLDFQI